MVEMASGDPFFICIFNDHSKDKWFFFVVVFVIVGLFFLFICFVCLFVFQTCLFVHAIHLLLHFGNGNQIVQSQSAPISGFSCTP